MGKSGFNPFLLGSRLASWYFLIVSALVLRGDLVFGHGLGDTFFAALLLIVGFFIQALLWVLKRRDHLSPLMQKVIAITLVLLALYCTYGFSIGRGPENPWNGDVFAWLHTGNELNEEARVSMAKSIKSTHFWLNGLELN